MTVDAQQDYELQFHEGLRQRRLMIQHCNDCGAAVFPAGPCCSTCLSSSIEWRTASGRGVLWAYVIYHHVFHPSFADRIPYNVSLVALDEGPAILSNVVGIGNELLKNGMRLEACFLTQADGTARLGFQLPDTSTGDH